MDHDLQITLDKEDIYPPTGLFSRDQNVKNFQTNEQFCLLRGYKHRLGKYILSSNQFGYYPAVSMNSSTQSISNTNQSAQNTSQSDHRFKIVCTRGNNVFVHRITLVIDVNGKISVLV
jgi:hypothetical protein